MSIEKFDKLTFFALICKDLGSKILEYINHQKKNDIIFQTSLGFYILTNDKSIYAFTSCYL